MELELGALESMRASTHRVVVKSERGVATGRDISAGLRLGACGQSRLYVSDGLRVDKPFSERPPGSANKAISRSCKALGRAHQGVSSPLEQIHCDNIPSTHESTLRHLDSVGKCLLEGIALDSLLLASMGNVAHRCCYAALSFRLR